MLELHAHPLEGLNWIFAKGEPEFEGHAWVPDVDHRLMQVDAHRFIAVGPRDPPIDFWDLIPDAPLPFQLPFQ